jgi:hypothetical protein
MESVQMMPNINVQLILSFQEEASAEMDTEHQIKDSQLVYYTKMNILVNLEKLIRFWLRIILRTIINIPVKLFTGLLW